MLNRMNKAMQTSTHSAMSWAKRQNLLLVLIMLLAPGDMPQASAGNFNVDGVSLHFPELEGFCDLPRDGQMEKDFYAVMERMEGGVGSRLIVISIPCNELGQFQQGGGMSEWTAWGSPVLSNKAKAELKKHSKTDILILLAKRFPSIDIRALKEKVASIAARQANLQIEQQELGSIHRERPVCPT